MHQNQYIHSTKQTSSELQSLKFDSFLIAFYACGAVASLFLFTASDRFLHWFLIPTILCGVLIGSDAVDWLRGRLDVFDPIGIIGLLGLHFFFLAPLLHVHWNYWMRYITPPSDWRPWLGYMAILNFLGLLVYRFFRDFTTSRRKDDKHSPKYTWQINEKLFPSVLFFALLVTGVLQLWVYNSYGGIQGYVNAFESARGAEAFAGMGRIFMVSESFPLLAIIGYAVWVRKQEDKPSWLILTVVAAIFMALRIVFGGLTGSRSNIIWATFWMAGIIHLWIRPIPRIYVYIGVIGLFLFMYAYGFYKSVGSEVTRLLETSDARFELEERTGRTVETLALFDLARTNIQAFVLYRLNIPNRDYEYAYGRTYVGTAALFVPKSLWPSRPSNKNKEGTDVQYGVGSYPSRDSAAVYGLAGETMLNFGPFFVPLAFSVLGIAVRKTREVMRQWRRYNDIRTLMAPMLINFCFVILIGDSDNVLVFLVKNGAIPFLVLFICAKIVPVPHQEAATT